MLELAAKHVSDDFHVAMRMCAEALAGHHEVVIDDAQAAVAHPFRVVVVGETERVVTVEPAVIGVAPFICFANCCCFHVSTLRLGAKTGKYHVSCLSITRSYTWLHTWNCVICDILWLWLRRKTSRGR